MGRRIRHTFASWSNENPGWKRVNAIAAMQTILMNRKVVTDVINTFVPLNIIDECHYAELTLRPGLGRLLRLFEDHFPIHLPFQGFWNDK